MLKANQHFILSFFGPPVFAALACYGVYLLNFWLEMKTPVLMTAFLATAVIFNLIGRWSIRTFIPVLMRSKAVAIVLCASFAVGIIELALSALVDTIPAHFPAFRQA